MYLSSYLGKDYFFANFDESSNQLKSSSENNLGWNNYTSALRWNYIFNSQLFFNSSITYSKYNYVTGRTSELEELTDTGWNKSSYSYIYDSGIEDIATKIDFEFIPSNIFKIKFGTNYIYHKFNPGVSVKRISNDEPEFANSDSTYGNSIIYANEIATYIDNTLKIGDYLSFNIGGRFSSFHVQNTNYSYFEPRASVRLLLSRNLSLKASYSHMTQYIHLLTNTGSSMPTDLWLPVTQRVKPIKAVQYALGSVYNINKQLNVSAEFYYKTMNNLIEYAEGSSFYSGFTEWEDMIESGKGWSYGFEVLLKKQFGKTTGWIAYTWSKTERQFENINFGESFPYKYDRRHDFSLTLTHKLKENFDLSVTWVYGTGNAFTMPRSKYISPNKAVQNYFGEYSSKELVQFDKRNSYRMPANHRLDLGFNFYKQKKNGMRTWSLGLYNAYNRKNAFYAEYSPHANQLNVVSIFPILPYFTYRFEF